MCWYGQRHQLHNYLQKQYIAALHVWFLCVCFRRRCHWLWSVATWWLRWTGRRSEAASIRGVWQKVRSPSCNDLWNKMVAHIHRVHQRQQLFSICPFLFQEKYDAQCFFAIGENVTVWEREADMWVFEGRCVWECPATVSVISVAMNEACQCMFSTEILWIHWMCLTTS